MGFKAGKDKPLEIESVQGGMRFTIADMRVILAPNYVRAICEYLDMEFVPPFMAFPEVVQEDGTEVLRIYQEDDGMAWFRVFHTETKKGRLSCLSDDETGQLYEWLNSQLDKM